MGVEDSSETAEQTPQKISKRRRQRPVAFDAIALAGGVLLFLVMLYTMERGASAGGFLSPPIVAAALGILVWPLRRRSAGRALLLSTGLILGLWFLDVLGAILAPFVVVYVLAFLFDPAVTRANQVYNVPRAITSLGVTILFVGVLATVILLIVPQLFGQLEDLAVRIIGSLASLREWVETTTVLDDLEAAGLISKQQLTQEITNTFQSRLSDLAESIPMMAERLFGYVTSILGLITILAIVPVILYYTLKDYPWIKRRLVELFPTFGGHRDYLVKAGGVVGNYLRGQLTISAIAAFNVSVALSLFNVPYALIIGFLAGILNLIPNFGAIITNIIAILMMLVFGREPWYRDVLIVLGVLMGQSLLETSVLTPKILSHSVGLHPVLIILSLFVFSYFMGWVGLLVAVPTTALLMTFYKSRREGFSFELSRRRSRESVRSRIRRRLGFGAIGRSEDAPDSDAGSDGSKPPA